MQQKRKLSSDLFDVFHHGCQPEEEEEKKKRKEMKKLVSLFSRHKSQSHYFLGILYERSLGQKELCTSTATPLIPDRYLLLQKNQYPAFHEL